LLKLLLIEILQGLKVVLLKEELVYFNELVSNEGLLPKIWLFVGKL